MPLALWLRDTKATARACGAQRRVLGILLCCFLIPWGRSISSTVQPISLLQESPVSPQSAGGRQVGCSIHWAFTWALGIWTQVLIFLWQGLYPVSRFLAPMKPFDVEYLWMLIWLWGWDKSISFPHEPMSFQGQCCCLLYVCMYVCMYVCISY